MRVASIYVLIDSDGARRYIGKANDPARRLQEHRRRGGRMWAVSFDVLETCDEAAWKNRERFWIAYGREQGWPLDNISDGGNGHVPRVCYEATRAKLRARVVTPETRAKISAANTGRRHTPETRQKLSEITRHYFESPEARAKVGAVHKGTHLTDEHREKITAASQALWATPEHQEKQRAAMADPEVRSRMRREFTAEHRAHIGEAGKGRVPWNKGIRGAQVAWNKGKHTGHVPWNKGVSPSPETRAKWSATRKGRVASPETRAKMSAAHRKRQAACESR